ncbi:nitroreductase [Thalassococcus sp. S3]|uniref:nitroreductase family protein n=1 Tax=Thalassococcus sp. S3 TaxID=2017482 RepID=UPI0010241114|nr:nitroreductase [Thalassococcus sp. S3]QBF30954.1 nitroreductase [Thalassococcus sp. S3]
MPDANPAALEFLLTRRSRPAKTLQPPVPDRETVSQLLTAAARSPDHGKLEPWRFIVLEGQSFSRLSALVAERGEALGKTPDDITKAQNQFDQAHLAVAVIEVQKPSEKIPPIEQTYSAGAVALALLNAALAAGWGANWLSGWPSHDTDFCAQGLGLTDGERVVGFIHIGTERSAPPERPRPAMDDITTWMSS